MSLELTKLFISHASEDKDTIARPLAEALVTGGFAVWYDEYSLRLGDSLRAKIDDGLSMTDFGIVILSPSFFKVKKKWTREELDGLTSVETERGWKVILPIWHSIGFAEIAKLSPTLAGKVAVSTSLGLDHVVRHVRQTVNDVASDPFRMRQDLHRTRIHHVSFAAASAFAMPTEWEFAKHPDVSWTQFGEGLLEEFKRLDQNTPNRPPDAISGAS